MKLNGHVMTEYEERTGADAWSGLRVAHLVERLRRYNEWRRGAEFEPPKPAQIGMTIDEAAEMLEAMARAIVDTLENNLHLADGDNCTLINLVRVMGRHNRGEKQPSFTIPAVAWGDKWEAGETMILPDPRLEWLNEAFDDFQENHWEIADCDEVKHFINWLVDRHGKNC